MHSKSIGTMFTRAAAGALVGCILSFSLACSGAPAVPPEATEYDAAFLQRVIQATVGAELDGALNLVFIFSPEDCVLCLDELEHWAARRLPSSVKVVGLTFHSNPDVVANYIKWQALPIEIHRGPPNPRFAHDEWETPIKVVLDERGEVIFTEGPIPAWRRVGRLEEFVRSALHARGVDE